MAKTPIQTENAPAAIGPYSQAIAAGSLLFISGQLGVDPSTRALVPGDIRQQTRQVMNNLGAVLKAAGCSFDQVVKTTIYLTNLADFAAVNEVYAEAFSAAPPARATVQVVALPLGAKVEIDAIAERADTAN
jgi:2-iminobutanoate/2-iminopropanoate deaminase